MHQAREFRPSLEGGDSLIRFVLLLVALAVGIALVAAHGLRGLVVVAILLLAASAPRTRAWNVAERFLVRLTGSRRRAAVLVMSTVIIILLAFEVYSLIHG